MPSGAAESDTNNPLSATATEEGKPVGHGSMVEPSAPPASPLLHVDTSTTSEAASAPVAAPAAIPESSPVAIAAAKQSQPEWEGSESASGSGSTAGKSPKIGGAYGGAGKLAGLSPRSLGSKRSPRMTPRSRLAGASGSVY